MPVTTENIKGLSELLETMKRLPPEIVSKGGGPVRQALREGGKLIQKEAIANVRRIIAMPNKYGRPPITSGTLEKSIILSRRKPRRQGERYQVRVKQSAKSPRKIRAAHYGGVLEFGYEGVPAKPWLRPAFESKKREALTVIIKELRQRLDRAVKRAKKG